MKNEDSQCFKWCVTRALNQVKHHSERITKELKTQATKLNWDGIEFLSVVFKHGEAHNRGVGC